ncbi:hypothetical protein ACFVIM_03975 [Streptomyces sp. NPDC057638]|uniref:hypothetical protein n=1 Tax=Streptomyces sp. NPDC057638 TaxID=3346190 RepID=UPI0036C6F1FC
MNPDPTPLALSITMLVMLSAIAVICVREMRTRARWRASVDAATGSAEKVREELSLLRRGLDVARFHEGEVCDRTGFYRHMLSALRDVGRSVDLTQLDSYPPRHYGTPEMVEYFELQKRRVQDSPQIKFRRIVAVPTPEKLEWLLDVIEGAQGCPNFQINVIDMSRAGFLPPPLSLQIFDRKELCLVDPTLGYMLPEDQRQMLWLRGSAAGEVFSVYYESLWTLGQRLKEGEIVYWDLLAGLHAELAARFPEKKDLLRRVGVRIEELSGGAMR